MRKRFYVLVIMLLLGSTSLWAQATYAPVNIPYNNGTYGSIGDQTYQPSIFAQPITLNNTCVIDRVTIYMYNNGTGSGDITCWLTNSCSVTPSVSVNSQTYTLSPGQSGTYTFSFSNYNYIPSNFVGGPYLQFRSANVQSGFKCWFGYSTSSGAGSPQVYYVNGSTWSNTGGNSLAVALYAYMYPITGYVQANAATNVTSTSFTANWTPYSTSPAYTFDPVSYYLALIQAAEEL